MDLSAVPWLDFVGPLLVIVLMCLMLFIIASSDAISGGRRQHPFPPTERDITALGRLWRQRFRRLRPS
jgi:hypothetical protein